MEPHEVTDILLGLVVLAVIVGIAALILKAKDLLLAKTKTGQSIRAWDKQASDEAIECTGKAMERTVEIGVNVVIVPVARLIGAMLPIIGRLLVAALFAFVVLGIIGLLVFGIRQIF